MIAFLALFFIEFTVAFAAGWYWYRSFFWNVVDLFYYPLAAIGIALLFVSNDVQRELSQVNQITEQQRVILADLKTKKPDVKLLSTEDRLTSSIESIALITKWADICRIGPSSASAEPQCLAVKELEPPVQAFLKVARSNFSSYEDRLLATCSAGDNLLDTIRTTQAISTLVTEKLLNQYVQAISLNLSPLEYETFSAQVDQFRERATSYVEEIHRLAFKPGDDSGKLLLDINKAEIEYGELLFRGLFECLTVPKADLSLLTRWTHTTNTQEVARLETLGQQLKETKTKHTTSLWLQLNFWPLVLVTALSLKFAKGAATFRKARSGPG